MGLAERRAVKEYQEQHYPTQLAKMNEAAGFEVPIEVNWDTLAVEKYAHLYQDGFTKVFFEPLAAAFAAICADDMGREALKEVLNKVVVCNTADKYGTSAFSFAEGILTADHHPTTNVNEVDARTSVIVGLLEKSL